MAKLGEAYVQVRADLKPFAKDLDRGIKDITDRFEKQLNRTLGRKIGLGLGQGTRDGLKEGIKGMGNDVNKELNVPANSSGRRAGRNFKKGLGDELKETNFVAKALSVLVSGLEDGFSALPVQVKAAAGAALLAAIIPLGAFIGAALGAALIVGINAAGVALAFQFQEVEDRGKAFASDLRTRLVEDAEAFGSATVNAFDLLDYRLEQMDGTFRNVFTRAADYLLPLTNGVINAVDGLFEGIDQGLQHADFEGISTTLEDGLEGIGDALGTAFDTILSNQDLDVALGDLLETIEDLVIAGGDFLSWTVDAWVNIRPVLGAIQDTVKAVYYLISGLEKLVTIDPGAFEDFANFFKIGQDGDRVGGFIGQATDDLSDFNRQIMTTIKLTDAETKSLQDINTAFDVLAKQARDGVTSLTDYYRAVDATSESLKKSKGSLDYRSEAGRTNIDNIQQEIESLGKLANARFTTGELTEEQAQAFYDKEIKRIRDEVKARGGSLKQFDELFGKYAELAGLPPIPDKTAPTIWGAQKAKSAFEKLEIAIRSAYKAAKNAPGGISGNIKVQGGTQLFADGGFVDSPTSAILGEGFRKEVVLPLTQPKRSMQLLSQSPLAGMMGAPQIVYAYFDGQPFQARIVRTAQGVNRRAARTLNQVPRNI